MTQIKAVTCNILQGNRKEIDDVYSVVKGVHKVFNYILHSSSPLSIGETFQDAQWLPETTDKTKYRI